MAVGESRLLKGAALSAPTPFEVGRDEAPPTDYNVPIFPITGAQANVSSTKNVLRWLLFFSPASV
jgi:hypothetical protein